MKVKATSYKKLIAVSDGNIINIPNRVMRKPYTLEQQDRYLTENSICIVCDYSFYEKKIEWGKKVKAVCHPFRDTKIFPDNIDKYLLSESDFCDGMITPNKRVNSKWTTKNYDFVYFTIESPKGVKCKGYHLLPLIDRCAKRLNLKGLVVCYSNDSSKKIPKSSVYVSAFNSIKRKLPKLRNIDVVRRFFSMEELNNIMNAVKFVLVPSYADASPRLLVEAIVRDRPVVVNENIYGGWKYVNEKTGSFFKAPTPDEMYKRKWKFSSVDIKCLSSSMKYVLGMENKKKEIKDVFYENYGFRNSSIRLADIINKISSTKYNAVAFKEWKSALKKVAKRDHWT